MATRPQITKLRALPAAMPAGKMDFVDRIHLIRSGLPAQCLGELASIMNLPKEVLIESLGLSRAALIRKIRLARKLPPGESERVMGIQMLIEHVRAMIEPENAKDFDAAKWFASWLISPLPALGGAKPASFLDTMEGQKYVGKLLEMTQNGTYT